MNKSPRLPRGLRRLAGVFGMFAIGAIGYAQTFTGGVAATGSGASNLYAALAHNASGEVYGIWKLQASTSGVHYVIKWNGTSWTQLSSFTAGQMYSGAQGTQDDVALAIDGNGGLHIASRVYGPGADLAAAPRMIMYGYSADGVSWTFTQIYASPANNSSYNTRIPSIAIDANNHPHILFRSDTPTYYGLRYYSFDGTSWSGSEIYTTSSRSIEVNSASFDLDSAGHAHIIFVAEITTGSDGSPFYMTNASGSWSTPTKLADGTSNTGPNVAVVVDANDKVHALYQGAGRAIYYYTNAAGSFSGAQVNGTLTGGITRHSFAINASGNMFFAYNPGATNSGTANYAFRLSGQSSWTTGTLHSTTDTANTATTALPVDLTNTQVATVLLNTLTEPRYLRWSQGAIASSNVAPTFVGSTTTFSVNQNASAADIKSLLHASDTDNGQTLTWSQNTAPSHGTLSFSNATASTGGTDITPGGTITYTPTAGYAGSDSFVVKISDGTASATRTISVAVNDITAPSISSIVRLTPTGQALTTATTSVTFRVTYSEAVQNVTTAQFAVQTVNGGSVSGTVSDVSGTGSTRDVTVTLSSGAGEFTLKAIN